jgi:voltage-gated potassium channel
MTLKQRVFYLIDDDNITDSKTNSFLSSAIMGLIILSIIAVILESDAVLSADYRSWFLYFEIVAVVIFTIEYLARIYTASLEYPHLSTGKAIWKYITSTMAIIDFLAILPFYIELAILIYSTLYPDSSSSTGMLDLRFIRVLRLMRLLRIFKLNRYNSSMQMIGDVIKEEKEKLFITIFITGILLVLSSAIIFTVEHDVQPEQFPNILSSMWWAIATLTTVGYGDVYPITALGKILSGVIALLGIGLVALPTGILSGSFVQAIKDQKAKDSQSADGVEKEHSHSCPHCGGALEHSHKVD